jgi:hypothetical protein
MIPSGIPQIAEFLTLNGREGVLDRGFSGVFAELCTVFAPLLPDSLVQVFVAVLAGIAAANICLYN